GDLTHDEHGAAHAELGHAVEDPVRDHGNPVGLLLAGANILDIEGEGDRCRHHADSRDRPESDDAETTGETCGFRLDATAETREYAPMAPRTTQAGSALTR